MKKLVFGLMFMSGIAGASCMGPYCWDDTGAQINAAPVLHSKTLSDIQALKPAAAGQIVYCSDCTNTMVCVSTGTGVNSFVIIGSTTPNAANAKLPCK